MASIEAVNGGGVRPELEQARVGCLRHTAKLEHIVQHDI